MKHFYSLVYAFDWAGFFACIYIIYLLLNKKRLDFITFHVAILGNIVPVILYYYFGTEKFPHNPSDIYLYIDIIIAFFAIIILISFYVLVFKTYLLMRKYNKIAKFLEKNGAKEILIHRISTGENLSDILRDIEKNIKEFEK